MSVSYSIEDHILIITAVGHYDITDLVRTFDAALTHPQFEPGLQLLLDWRQAVALPRVAELPSRWANLASVKSLFSSQVAFVASQPADLERARLFAIYVRPQGFIVEIFTDQDAARRWLLSNQTAES